MQTQFPICAKCGKMNVRSGKKVYCINPKCDDFHKKFDE